MTYSDPFVPSIRLDHGTMTAAEMDAQASVADCVVIVTDHTGVNYEEIIKRSKLIVDTRNALKHYPSEKIVRL